MSLIDFLVYFFLFVVAPLGLYLKKTGKTFVEFVRDIKEFFNGINEE